MDDLTATSEKETKLHNTVSPYYLSLQYLFPCIYVGNIFEDKIHEKSLHFQRPHPRTMNFSTQNGLNSFPYIHEAILWGNYMQKLSALVITSVQNKFSGMKLSSSCMPLPFSSTVPLMAPSSCTSCMYDQGNENCSTELTSKQLLVPLIYSFLLHYTQLQQMICHFLLQPNCCLYESHTQASLFCFPLIMSTRTQQYV